MGGALDTSGSSPSAVPRRPITGSWSPARVLARHAAREPEHRRTGQFLQRGSTFTSTACARNGPRPSSADHRSAPPSAIRPSPVPSMQLAAEQQLGVAAGIVLLFADLLEALPAVEVGGLEAV